MSPAVATRRQFLTQAARWGALAAAGSALPASLLELLGPAPAGAAVAGLEKLLRDAPVARYWLSSDDPGAHCASCHVGPAPGPAQAGTGYRHRTQVVQCQLCPHRCVLAEGERGRCRVRAHVGGQLRSLAYGRPLSEHIDPIEKKPFYHFLPGALAYSLATAGCPLRCQFCQNWEISQAQPEDYDTPYCGPADMARRVAAARGGTVPVVAFTYNEPTVFCEYLIDIADQVRADGRRTVMISCGYTNPEPLGQMLGALDAVKIDLKGFDPGFYRSVCSAELDPVLRSIRQVASSGRHLELVNLVVPTLNDSERQLTDLAHWVANEVGPDVAVHFTRFHPDYRLRNLPPTPVETLERARAIAMDQGVRYAYVGNVPGHEGNHTYCPQCRRLCIERVGFAVASTGLVDGCCPACGTRIAGVWR
jgi:pyruvate formate lyase activating enzyme